MQHGKEGCLKLLFSPTQRGKSLNIALVQQQKKQTFKHRNSDCPYIGCYFAVFCKKSIWNRNQSGFNGCFNFQVVHLKTSNFIHCLLFPFLEYWYPGSCLDLHCCFHQLSLPQRKSDWRVNSWSPRTRDILPPEGSNSSQLLSPPSDH